MSSTLERHVRIYDNDGRFFSISPDLDGLGLVRLASTDNKESMQFFGEFDFTITPEFAAKLAEALSRVAKMCNIHASAVDKKGNDYWFKSEFYKIMDDDIGIGMTVRECPDDVFIVQMVANEDDESRVAFDEIQITLMPEGALMLASALGLVANDAIAERN